MQRTSKGDCKAPEIVQGEAIHDWRIIPVGSCSWGLFRWLLFVWFRLGGGGLPELSRGRTSRPRDESASVRLASWW
jgi:hypothetical protein